MALCTLPQAISKLPSQNLHSHKLLFQNPNSKTITTLHSSSSSFSLSRRTLLSAPGLHYRSLYSQKFVPRSASEETSSGSSYGSEERDAVATLQEKEKTEEEPQGAYGSTVETQVVTKEESPFYEKSTEVAEEQSPIFEILDKLNIDTSDTYSLALYSALILFVLWISSAVVGAIDAIPLFPKLMELVGLGYTIWFTYRYLIFKSQREELFAKFDELKEEVFGSIDD